MSPEGCVTYVSGRSKKGSHRGPFFMGSVLDHDENSCSTKRVSVLDAEGAPKG